MKNDIDELPSYVLPAERLWYSLWGTYVLCHCGGICKLESTCTVCGEEPQRLRSMRADDGDGSIRLQGIFESAEGRYEDSVLLQMIQHEITKTIEPNIYASIPEPHRPSARASVVLVFWTYFEARIERLLRETAISVPSTILDHLLSTNRDISRRITHLYKVVFSSTYFADLSNLGFERPVQLLQTTHSARNRFIHGYPEAIDDAVVDNLIDGLEDEHRGWIAVFNHRLKECRTQLSTLMRPQTERDH